MSIQKTLSRWLAFQTLFGLAIVCLAVYGATSWSFSQRQQEEFQRHALIVQHVIQEAYPRQQAALQHKLNDYFQSHQDASVLLFTAQEEIYSSGVVESEGSWRWFEGSVAGTEMGGKPLHMRLGIDVAQDQAQLRRLAWILFCAAVFGTAMVSASGLLLVRRALKPLQRLTQETAAAGPISRSRICAETYDEELRPWIAQFNSLLDRVDGAYAQLESFNADVAHELKTPLANLVAQGEVELSRERSTDEMRGVLESQLEDVRRLSSIVNDMLFLSRSDRGVTARRALPQSLAQQVFVVCEFMEVALEEAGLSVMIQGDAEVKMDASLIRRAIANLIGNAMRYADRDSVIRVLIDRDGLQVKVAVQNTGPALEAVPPARIFERFYRADYSRAGSSAHHGLGLAIVAAVARMHGGATFAHSEQGSTSIGFSVDDIRT